MPEMVHVVPVSILQFAVYIIVSPAVMPEPIAFKTMVTVAEVKDKPAAVTEVVYLPV